ncbi:hypothetical protein Aduo_011603 [Ancylostoma duodenale]
MDSQPADGYETPAAAAAARLSDEDHNRKGTAVLGGEQSEEQFQSETTINEQLQKDPRRSVQEKAGPTGRMACERGR